MSGLRQKTTAANARQLIKVDGFAYYGFGYALGIDRGILRNVIVNMA